MSDEKDLDSIFPSYEGKRSELIPILQHVQAELGYLPGYAMKKIAKFTGCSESNVFGVVSFYAQFRLKPAGRNQVMVCRGTACDVRGAPQILEEIGRQLGIEDGESTEDLEYSLETVACIGCCALAPCVMVHKDVHGRLNMKKVAKIFPEKEQKEEE